MKRSEIKAGVVYGYAQGTSEYRSAYPVIVLDADRLWTWRNADGVKTWRPTDATQYTSGDSWGYYGAEGYLVLGCYNTSDAAEQARRLTELEALYVEFTALPRNRAAMNALMHEVADSTYLFLDTINNRWLDGEYAAAKNAEEERSRARDAEYRAERDRAAAERALMDEVSGILTARLERPVSVQADRSWGSDTRGAIPLDDLAAFFGLKTVKDRL